MTHAVTTRFVGTTATKGAQIEVLSEWGVQSYPYAYHCKHPHREAFREWFAWLNRQHAFTEVSTALLPDASGHVFIIEQSKTGQ